MPVTFTISTATFRHILPGGESYEPRACVICGQPAAFSAAQNGTFCATCSRYIDDAVSADLQAYIDRRLAEALVGMADETPAGLVRTLKP